MESLPKKVSFVTVCYKTPHLIRVLLRGFERANVSVPFEYFLIDNGGDGTAEMVRERFPWVRVIEPGENLGFAKANNLAFRQSSGEYIMLINPDLIIFPGEIEKLLAFADREPSIGLCGPRLENPDGSRQETCTRFPGGFIPLYRRTFFGKTSFGKRVIDAFFMRDRDHEHVHDVDSLYGAAILARRSALQEIGYFDERFFMYYEDVDLCRRAWERGWRVTYVPLARFVHYHQRESRIQAPWELVTNRLVRIHIMSSIRYMAKYLGKQIPQTSVIQSSSEGAS